jgi:hypothetical protein
MKTQRYPCAIELVACMLSCLKADHSCEYLKRHGPPPPARGGVGVELVWCGDLSREVGYFVVED